ncbi:MAG: hypothetical protein ACOH5I_09640 [Oligoflexus sp.]
MPIKVLYCTLLLVAINHLSCRNMDNTWDSARFYCGESVSESYRYIAISGDNIKLTDAVGMEDGQVQAFKVLNDACIEVPLEFSGKLIYRSPADSQNLDLSFAPRREFLELKSGSSLIKFSEQMKCPENLVYSAGLLDLDFVRQEAVNFGFFLHEIFIYDQTKQLVGRRSLNSASLPLSLESFDLDDGSFKLVIQSADVFELAKGLATYNNSCQLIIDRTAPLVRSSLMQQEVLRDDLFKLNADQAINFVVDEAYPKAIYYCLARSENASHCLQETDYKFVQDVVPAPQEGIWTLHYYAEDQAGNRSAVIRENFAVYHQQEVELIRKNFLNSALYGLAKRAQEGVENYTLALQAYDTLSLDEEREALYWDLIGSFWRLEENITLRYELDLSGINRLWADPFSNRFVAAAGNGTAYLVESQSKSVLDEGIQDIVFLKNGDIAALKITGEFLAIQGEKRTQLATPVRRGNITVLPDGRSLVYGNEGLFLLDTRQGSLEVKIIRKLEGRIPGFGPNYVVSNDQQYLVFYHRNQIELISLQENPEFQARYAMKLAPPCGVTNVYFHDETNVVIVGRFSVTLNQEGNDRECGIVRWNPEEDTLSQYKYTGEIGSDYTPENSFFRKKGDVLSLVVHDSLGPAYYYGLHQVSAQWGLNSGIGWGLTQVGSSFNQLNQIRPSYSRDYLINHTEREIVVTPTPYPYLDQSPLLKLEESAGVAELIADETAIVVSGKSGLNVHSLTNSIQGKLTLVDTEDVDKTDFYNDSQPLFAHDAQSGVSYDWAKQRFVFHNEFFQPTRSLPVDAVPTSMVFFEKNLIWSDRTGNVYLLREEGEVKIAEGFDFIKRIEIASSLEKLIIIDVNKRYEERVSFLKAQEDGSYQLVFQSPVSYLPIAFRQAPAKDSFLFAIEIDWGIYEVSVFDFDFNLISKFQHANNTVFYRTDGQAIIYPNDGDHLIVKNLANQSTSKVPLAAEQIGQSIKRLIANHQFVFYSTDQGVFRQTYAGNTEKLAGLTDVIQLDAQFILALKGQNNLVLIDTVSLKEVASTQTIHPILTDNTELLGDEIFIYGKDPAKRRFNVRRLSLNPESIRKAMQSWSRPSD